MSMGVDQQETVGIGGGLISAYGVRVTGACPSDSGWRTMSDQIVYEIVGEPKPGARYHFTAWQAYYARKLEFRQFIEKLKSFA